MVTPATLWNVAEKRNRSRDTAKEQNAFLQNYGETNSREWMYNTGNEKGRMEGT